MTDPLRRASDTRADPSAPGAAGAPAPGPTPGRRKLDIMGQAATSAASAPRPLTRDQAKQLVEQNYFTPDQAQFKNLIITKLVEESNRVPANKRRMFGVLLELAKHPCSKETIQVNIKRLFEDISKIRERGDPLEIEGIPLKIDSVAWATAQILESGFEKASPTHFILDSNGKVIDVSNVSDNRTRYGRMCIPYLNSEKNKWRAGPSELEYGGKKTRKHKRRNKKTLRRRKVRRNVH